MATIFYIILVIFSDKVEWSWWWFFISLLFSGATEGRTVYKYVYTRNPNLEGEESEEEDLEEDFDSGIEADWSEEQKILIK